MKRKWVQLATLAQFSKNIRRRGNQVENGGTRLVKSVAKRALRRLVWATPVDKGVARSNWRVGIGAAPTAVIPAYAPGRHLGINETANGQAAINAGIARINGFSPGQGRALKKSISIANNTPYIGALNAGSSKQAPAGFVEVALDEARATIGNFRFFETGFGGDDD